MDSPREEVEKENEKYLKEVSRSFGRLYNRSLDNRVYLDGDSSNFPTLSVPFSMLKSLSFSTRYFRYLEILEARRVTVEWKDLNLVLSSIQVGFNLDYKLKATLDRVVLFSPVALESEFEGPFLTLKVGCWVSDKTSVHNNRAGRWRCWFNKLSERHGLPPEGHCVVAVYNILIENPQEPPTKKQKTENFLYIPPLNRDIWDHILPFCETPLVIGLLCKYLYHYYGGDNVLTVKLMCQLPAIRKAMTVNNMKYLGFILKHLYKYRELDPSVKLIGGDHSLRKCISRAGLPYEILPTWDGYRHVPFYGVIWIEDFMKEDPEREETVLLVEVSDVPWDRLDVDTSFCYYHKDEYEPFGGTDYCSPEEFSEICETHEIDFERKVEDEVALKEKDDEYYYSYSSNEERDSNEENP